MKKDGGKELPPKPGQRRSRRGISPLYTIRPGPQPPYRYFRALPRTRLSNTPAPDRRVRRVERVHHRLRQSAAPSTQPAHTHLDIQLPHLHQKRPDPLVVLAFVQQHKLHVCTPSSSCRSKTVFLTAWGDERRHRPFIELVYRFQIPATPSLHARPTARITHIVFSLRITSSITSSPAFAIIWITWRSCPPPTRTEPPLVVCVALDAPDSAVRVPANADVDHVGRFDANGTSHWGQASLTDGSNCREAYPMATTETSDATMIWETGTSRR